MKITLGIDIGGSAIKGALINIETGELVSKRLKIPTPQESSIDNIILVIQDILKHFDWSGIIGCTFPGVILEQTIKTSSNLNKSCINVNLKEHIKEATGLNAWIINDADAAALAEIQFGSGKGFQGSGLMITIGTGLGSAFFYNGKIFPNTELGHLIINDTIAEARTSAAAMENENLSWEAWAARFNQYLNYVHSLFWPQRIILGGGLSKEFSRFSHLLKVPAELMPAQFHNHSGIIGSALAAYQKLSISP